MADIKKLLALRKKMKSNMPHYKRDGWYKKSGLGDKWRAPKGRHNKQRHGFAGHSSKVKPGFGTNNLVKHLDKSGLLPVLVNSIDNISILDKNIHGVIVGKHMGDRKRVLILEELKKKGIKVLNLKEDYAEKAKQKVKLRQEVKEKKLLEKQKKKSKEEKKEVKKEEMTQEEKEKAQEHEKHKVLTKVEK
jgi:large subunit ribosomal protein L32e